MLKARVENTSYSLNSSITSACYPINGTEMLSYGIDRLPVEEGEAVMTGKYADLFSSDKI